MSKIICDVCGTSYPETATQCPICGCVRSGNVAPIDFDNEKNEESGVQTYTYVKGGKFSKTNVKKRNQGIMPEVKSTTTGPQGEPVANKGDRGLVIAICTLLLAIVAVVIYIVVNFFSVAMPEDQKPNDIEDPDVTPNIQQTEQTPVDTTISCIELTLSEEEVTLTGVGAVYTINVVKSPVDTTDELTFTSENTAIATVSDSGEITAIAEGQTTIFVQCGDAKAQCNVICKIEPPVVPPDPTTQYKAPYRINKTDVSIDPDESFRLKLLDSDGKTIPVEWNVGNTDVCTVSENTVTGVGSGSTWISVTFDGVEYKCRVIVRRK